MLSAEVHDFAEPFDNTYAASTGILTDPSGFGVKEILNSSKTTDKSAVDHLSANAPTIKGALGDLHKAVTGKIGGWKGQQSSVSTQTATTIPEDDTIHSVNATLKIGEQVKDGQTEEELLGARTRVGKCTILFGGNGLWERAIKTHEAHDRMHGYRLHILRQHLLDDVWSKPAYILSLLLREMAKPEHERLEWLFWVDADTIILNPYISIETFLPPAGEEFDHIHLLYSNDWNGLNNGVFPVRVNKWAVELFTAITSYRYYRPDGDLTFRDQSAMNTLMNEPKFAKNIMQLPQRWFNAYQGEHNETLAPYQIRRGDFLVHFAGVVDRDPRMKFWLDRAEQHLDDWEVPQKSTSYPQEVKDFWQDQRGLRQSHKNGVSEARLAASESLTKIDNLLTEYADRLPAEQLEAIKAKKEEMRNFLGNEEHSENLVKLKELQGQLDDAILPLQSVKTESHKLMLGSAHEAIFAGEKDLLESGFYRGVSDPEVVELDAALKHLKDYVLSSEDLWDKQQLITAMDTLMAARGHLKEKTADLQAAEISKQKGLEEEKKKAADLAAAVKAKDAETIKDDDSDGFDTADDDY